MARRPRDGSGKSAVSRGGVCPNRQARPKPSPFAYPSDVKPCRVRSNGSFCFRGYVYPLAQALDGSEIAVEVLALNKARLWFRDLDLGMIELVPDVSPSMLEEPHVRRAVKAS